VSFHPVRGALVFARCRAAAGSKARRENGFIDRPSLVGWTFEADEMNVNQPKLFSVLQGAEALW
jgi:hypothetical protein